MNPAPGTGNALHCFVNGVEIVTTDFEPHETLLDFLRGKKPSDSPLSPKTPDHKTLRTQAEVSPGRSWVVARVAAVHGDPNPEPTMAVVTWTLSIHVWQHGDGVALGPAVFSRGPPRRHPSPPP